MKKLGIFILIIVGCIGYYKYSYPDYTYRYKMTVEIDTPEGVKSGSSVIEVRTNQWAKWLSGGGAIKNSRAYGEAPFVDLGERGILFTAFKGSYSERVYARLFTGRGHGYRPINRKRIPDYATAIDFKIEVPKEHYPTLVRFKDLNNPMSVEKILPDDLATNFGDNIKLKKIIIEVTSDNLEWKIEKILKWLPNRKHTKGYLGGEAVFPYKDPTGLYFNGSEFIKKMNKE